MIDWIKTPQGVAAMVPPASRPVVAWWNLGLPLPGSRCSTKPGRTSSTSLV